MPNLLNVYEYTFSPPHKDLFTQAIPEQSSECSKELFRDASVHVSLEHFGSKHT